MAQFVMSDINLSAFKITAKRKRTRFGNVILHETLNHKSGRFVQQELTGRPTWESYRVNIYVRISIFLWACNWCVCCFPKRVTEVNYHKPNPSLGKAVLKVVQYGPRWMCVACALLIISASYSPDNIRDLFLIGSQVHCPNFAINF